MNTTLLQLASTYGGSVLGAGDVQLRGVAPLGQAGPTDLAPLLHPRYIQDSGHARAGALLTSENLARRTDKRPLWIHREPRRALASLLTDLAPERHTNTPAIHPSAIIDSGAQVHETATIGALTVVGADAVVGPRALIAARAFIDVGARVGADSMIGPGAMVLERCVVGDRVRLGPGSIVGADGFGFLPGPKGEIPTRIPQLGRVVIEDDVDLGALTVIDRATIGETIIRKGAKLDNLIQVGHNGDVGESAIIAAQSGLAGSVTIGDRALIGGQVGIADHHVIGQGARIAAKSGVITDVPAERTVAGDPAIAHQTWLRVWGTLTRKGTRRGERER